ncbi:MAG: hypothetical protein IPN97_07785 [Saprospiraceae bacterium]|nr:hypothetical protein [Saprospiraceae bacterium]
MKYLIAAYFALLIVSSLDAQKYFSKNASIRFYSDTPFEKIEGINSSASTVLTKAQVN